MKLRYQMRGLGIGMIVTALLMGVSAERGIPLSDAEIRAKALELGMVESDSLRLSDISNSSPAPDAGSAGTANTPDVPGREDENGTPGNSGEDPESAVDPGSGEENPGGEGWEPAADPESGGDNPANRVPESENAGRPEESHAAGAQSVKDGDIVTIDIESGETSYRICIMLEELGLVEDAAEFDTYLCDNGYSRKIRYGTYEIPMGAGEEEIAKIITRNR